MTKEISIEWDDQSVSVYSNKTEVVYIDKHSDFESVAAMLYDLIEISDVVKSVVLMDRE